MINESLIKPFVMKKTILSSNAPKRSVIGDVIAAILLIIFLQSFIANYFEFQSLQNLLPFYTKNVTITAWVVVIGKALISVALFIPRTRIIGIMAAMLSVIYGGYLVYKFPAAPHRFGGLVNEFTNTQHFIFYSVILLLCLSALWFKLKVRKLKVEPDPDAIVFT
jgi:hypothetical protein